MQNTTEPKARGITPAIINQLLEINRNTRASVGESQLSIFKSSQRAREYHTVSLSAVKQSGMTTTIALMADDDSVIFVVNNSLRDQMKDLLLRHGKPKASARVFTALDFKNSFGFDEVKKGKFERVITRYTKDWERNPKPKTVFVDGASYFFERVQIHGFYRCIVGVVDADAEYIFLG